MTGRIQRGTGGPDLPPPGIAQVAIGFLGNTHRLWTPLEKQLDPLVSIASRERFVRPSVKCVDNLKKTKNIQAGRRLATILKFFKQIFSQYNRWEALGCHGNLELLKVCHSQFLIYKKAGTAMSVLFCFCFVCLI